jgi:O-antigen/teichoic acid export membrane protein
LKSERGSADVEVEPRDPNVSTARTIAKNAAFLFVLRASGFILSFLLGMKLGRGLGAEGLGVYTLATTYLQVFVLIPNFGFDTLAIRDLARDRAGAGAYIANVVWAKLALTIPAYALLAAVVFLLGYPPDTRTAILVLGACLFFDPLAEAAAAIFQGFERMELLTLVSGGAKVVVTTISLVLLERGAGVLDVLFVQLAGSAAVVPIFALMTARLVPGIRAGVSLEKTRALAVEAAPLFLTNLIGLLYLRTDVLILSKLRGESEVGLYGAAASVLRVLAMLPGIFVTAIYPALSRAHAESGDRGPALRRLCDVAFRWQLAIGAPLVAGIAALGAPILELVYGPAFARAGTALSILITALLFFFTNTLLGYMLFTANRQSEFLRIKVVTLALNVALNFALVPRFGIEGSAAATAGTVFLSFFMHERLVARFLYPVRFLALAAKPLAGAAVLYAAVRAMSGLPLAALVPLGAAIYIVVMILLRFVSPDDAAILRRIVRRGSPALPDKSV